MTENVAEPPQQQTATLPRAGAPWYVVAAVALLAVFSCGVLVSEGRMMNSADQFKNHFIPSLLLIPVAAAVAWIPWAIKRKRSGMTPRFASYFMWTVVSLPAAMGLLALVASLVDARMKAAAAVPPWELQKVVIFDGSMSWSKDGERRNVYGVSGRIRNETTKAIEWADIAVTIRDAQGKVIESFAFGHYLGLKPGEAKGFDHQTFIQRVPQDMTWDWKLTGARYAY